MPRAVRTADRQPTPPRRAGARRETELVGQRRWHAVEVNDEVVQRLTLAKLALDLGDLDAVADHLQRALDNSKHILGRLADEAPSLRRERAALES